MKKRALALITTLSLFTGLVGCDKNVDTATQPEQQEHSAVSETQSDFSESVETSREDIGTSNLEDSIFLADYLYENVQGNIVFSPISLNIALAMASEGATDSTKAKLDSYLNNVNYSSVITSLSDKYAKYDTSNEEDYLYNDFSSGDIALNIGNSVWISKDREIILEYVRTVQELYNAEIGKFDISDPDASANIINKWGNEKTKGLIPKIIVPEQITEDSSVILLNTIYFNDSWGAQTWNAYDKADNVFYNIDGTKSKNALMTNTKINNYLENSYAEAFKLHYCTGTVFVGILPKEKGEFCISDLDIEGLLNSDQTDSYEEIHAIMPKFKYDTSYDVLKDGLSNLGLNEMFTPDAHFENIIKIKPIETTYISNVIQKCNISLDEYGTEASAETAFEFVTLGGIWGKESVPKIKEIRIDRPFAYLIMDEETGQILFMGKVVNLDSMSFNEY